MATPTRPLTSEQAKILRENLAKELWLLYFNNVLYDKGMITERERNQMKNKISALFHPSRGGYRS